MGNVELMNEAFNIAHEVNIVGINQRVLKLLEDKKKLEECVKKEQKKKEQLLAHYEALLVKIAQLDVNDKDKVKNIQHHAFKTLDLIEIVKGVV